jgi:hypothetical protein
MALRQEEQLIDYENIELEDVNGFYGSDNFKTSNSGFQEPDQR